MAASKFGIEIHRISSKRFPLVSNPSATRFIINRQRGTVYFATTREDKKRSERVKLFMLAPKGGIPKTGKVDSFPQNRKALATAIGCAFARAVRRIAGLQLKATLLVTIMWSIKALDHSL